MPKGRVRRLISAVCYDPVRVLWSEFVQVGLGWAGLGCTCLPAFPLELAHSLDS